MSQQAQADAISAAQAVQQKPKKNVVAKSSVLFAIKPFQAETDLQKLKDKILSEVQMEGLVWSSAYKLVPIAFSIKKLMITCIIEDDLVLVDQIIQKIQAYEDEVQSVDIEAFEKA